MNNNIAIETILNNLKNKGFNQETPMLSLPFLDWINSYDWSEYEYVEFGGGYSTNYMAKLFKTVESIETKPHWYQKILESKKDNVFCHLMSQVDIEIGNYNISLGDKALVLVDSDTHRFLTIKVLLSKVTPGIIVLDNSEWYPNTSKFLYNQGYTEIPFWGIKTEIEDEPDPTMEKCTSVFIKNGYLLPNRKYDFSSIGSHVWTNYPLDNFQGNQ